jgi:hypothetical protein
VILKKFALPEFRLAVCKHLIGWFTVLQTDRYFAKYRYSPTQPTVRDLNTMPAPAAQVPAKLPTVSAKFCHIIAIFL